MLQEVLLKLAKASAQGPALLEKAIHNTSDTAKENVKSLIQATVKVVGFQRNSGLIFLTSCIS